MTMQLICWSISHHNTPVELRECLSLSPEALTAAFTTAPVHSQPYDALAEMVILSTCNRLEVYALVNSTSADAQGGEAAPFDEEDAFAVLLSYLREIFEMPVSGLRPYYRRFAGSAAVAHLFRVTAGLDSIAIGETQILGQVSRALEIALQQGTARHVLASLFRAAIFTGKRVRAETAIGRHPTSISTVAVQLAEQVTGRLAERRVLVIGAGKMGAITLGVLSERRAGQVTLVSRTYSHALEMAAHFEVQVLPYEQLVDALAQADVVFTSSAAPLPILRQEIIAQVMTRRAGQPLALIDLAVPRNVDTHVREIPGAQVYDMDDLQTFARDALADSYPEIQQADAIVAEEVTKYEKLLRIVPFLGELHKKVEDIRQREVEKTLRHLRATGGADAQLAEQIELLSRSLVRKILHEPTMHLRTETNQETLNDYVEILGKLFDLDENKPELSLEEHEPWER